MSGGVFMPVLVIELKFIAKAWRFWLAVVPPLLVCIGGRMDLDGATASDLMRRYLFSLGFFAIGVSAGTSRGTSLLELVMTRAASLRAVLCARLLAYGLAIAIVGLVYWAYVLAMGGDLVLARLIATALAGTLFALVSLTLVTEPDSDARVWVSLTALGYGLWLFWSLGQVPFTVEPWMVAASPFVLAAAFVVIGFLTLGEAEPIAAARRSLWQRAGWSFGFWAFAALVGLMLLVVWAASSSMR